MVSDTGGMMVTVSADDIPPAGAGLNTVTLPLPSAATSAADRDACSFVPLINCVGLGAPFHSTIEKMLNPLPVTVSVSAPSPARIAAGESDVMTGTGLSIATSVDSAWNARTRGTVTGSENKKRLSVTGRPVVRSALRIVLTLASGAASL